MTLDTPFNLNAVSGMLIHLGATPRKAKIQVVSLIEAAARFMDKDRQRAADILEHALAFGLVAQHTEPEQTLLRQVKNDLPGLTTEQMLARLAPINVLPA